MFCKNIVFRIFAKTNKTNKTNFLLNQITYVPQAVNIVEEASVQQKSFAHWLAFLSVDSHRCWSGLCNSALC